MSQNTAILNTTAAALASSIKPIGIVLSIAAASPLNAVALINVLLEVIRDFIACSPAFVMTPQSKRKQHALIEHSIGGKRLPVVGVESKGKD